MSITDRPAMPLAGSQQDSSRFSERRTPPQDSAGRQQRAVSSCGVFFPRRFYGRNQLPCGCCGAVSSIVVECVVNVVVQPNAAEIVFVTLDNAGVLEPLCQQLKRAR